MNSSDGWNFSASTLGWPSYAGYTTYSGSYDTPFAEFNSTTTAIVLPVSFSIENISSTNLYVGTNSFIYFTDPANPGVYFSIAGPSAPGSATGVVKYYTSNPGDLFFKPSAIGSPVTNDDGDVHNIYYQTGSSGNKSFVKIIQVSGYAYSGPSGETLPSTWLLNFYRDNLYQWIETRAKTNFQNSAGPFDSPSVAQSASTTSKVWRGNLAGTSWTYMGTGSVV
jgi:hypothetical protein